MLSTTTCLSAAASILYVHAVFHFDIQKLIPDEDDDDDHDDDLAVVHNVIANYIKYGGVRGCERDPCDFSHTIESFTHDKT
jgi:hypothetical protein